MSPDMVELVCGFHFLDGGFVPDSVNKVASFKINDLPQLALLIV
jgi:hypothetical protein